MGTLADYCLQQGVAYMIKVCLWLAIEQHTLVSSTNITVATRQMNLVILNLDEKSKRNHKPNNPIIVLILYIYHGRLITWITNLKWQGLTVLLYHKLQLSFWYIFRILPFYIIPFMVIKFHVIPFEKRVRKISV